MGRIIVLDHPLIKHKLSILRQKETGTNEFRKLVSEIAMLEAYEATRDLELEPYAVETPLTTTTGYRLAGKKLAFVPILRAGLGMIDGFISIIPTAKVGHIGLYRDPETFKPVEYYCKLPSDVSEREIFVLDPMLATGGSAIAAIDFLKNHGCRSIRMVNIIGCPEGVEAMSKAHPDVDIYLAGMDECLNDHAYILPGLGDAGDRLFGTK
ncbi:MAG: uracil phosphoribosyltransferase [Ndongobacter sp.]|nr:uracil phosphoribosyltransferase [Ndongobacter sp.]